MLPSGISVAAAVACLKNDYDDWLHWWDGANYDAATDVWADQGSRGNDLSLQSGATEGVPNQSTSGLTVEGGIGSELENKAVGVTADANFFNLNTGNAALPDDQETHVRLLYRLTSASVNDFLYQFTNGGETHSEIRIVSGCSPAPCTATARFTFDAGNAGDMTHDFSIPTGWAFVDAVLNDQGDTSPLSSVYVNSLAPDTETGSVNYAGPTYDDLCVSCRNGFLDLGPEADVLAIGLRSDTSGTFTESDHDDCATALGL